MHANKEDVALNSLRDISDYSSYIEQRISKLNNLYRSLTIDPTQDNPKMRPNIRPLRHNATKLERPAPKMYQTLQQSFHHIRAPSLHHTMYISETNPKRNRYDDKPQQARTSQLRQLSISINSLPRRETQRKDTSLKQEKLQMYQNIKMDMLGTFYVGGRTIDGRGTEEWKHHYEQEKRKGRVWHGRPPVKIIELD